MQVIFDIQRTGRRYMSDADLQQECLFLGLEPTATTAEIAAELHRRGLDDFSAGRAMKMGPKA